MYNVVFKLPFSIICKVCFCKIFKSSLTKHRPFIKDECLGLTKGVSYKQNTWAPISFMDLKDFNGINRIILNFGCKDYCVLYKTCSAV